MRHQRRRLRPLSAMHRRSSSFPTQILQRNSGQDATRPIEVGYADAKGSPAKVLVHASTENTVKDLLRLVCALKHFDASKYTLLQGGRPLALALKIKTFTAFEFKMVPTSGKKA